MNAFIDSNGVLVSYGWAQSNNGDTLIQVPDTFSYAPGSVQYVGGAWVPFASTLAQAQETQAALLSAACAAAITAGFQSTALGSTFTYPAKTTDQQNLSASIIAALLAAASAVQWAPETVFTAGQIATVGGQLYTCVAGGPSGAQAPVWPTVAGAIASDSGAQWELWTTPFWCEDAGGNWAFRNHTSPQIQRVGLDAKGAILSNMALNVQLSTQVAMATTVAAVQAIVWP